MDGGTVSCQTSPYRPAIFTAKHDNSVGETIAGSTGNPDVNEDQNYYFAAMNVDPLDLHDLRLAYCYCGISPINGHATLRNIQFVHAAYPFWIVTTAGCRVQNTLMYDVQYAFDVVQSAVAVEHLTVDQCQQLGLNDFQATLALTNSLLAGVQGLGNIPLTTNVVFLTATNETVFQTVGAGRHYLASNSPYRDTGTTNISPDLLADLKKLTTYPPAMIATNITANTTLSPQAWRDTDVPDLGYHYYPLDFVWTNVSVSEGVYLCLTNGVAVGMYGGFAAIRDFGVLISQGRPDAMNRVVAYQAAQEIAATNTEPQIYLEDAVLRFTDFAGLGRLRPLTLSGTASVQVSDSWFRGMSVQISRFTEVANLESVNCGAMYQIPVRLKNNLFERCHVNLKSGMEEGSGAYYYQFDWPLKVTLENNLFWRGQLDVSGDYAPCGWVQDYDYAFYNNAFDNVTANISGYYMDYAGNGDVGTSSGIGDLYLSSSAYVSGPLGGWYQAFTSFANAGSGNADVKGLYHYTTSPTQVKETNSVVDIGFHYVATDACGNPLDADNDSVPDYLEDANGNGVYDGGDPWDWQTADADTDGDNLPDWWELKYFGNLSQPWDGDYDSDGTNNLDEFYAGTDPNTIWFDAHFENLFVNQGSVAGVCNVHGGVPAQMALLVNNTNLAAATWTAYASNFTATLGATDGVYLVRVALRGLTTNFPPVWDDTTITLDRVPPALVITNPVSLPATVGRPYLQLLGCADEPLAGVEYDITNAAGVLTNELGFVVDQVFDTNRSSFTTNYFQCYDVALTNGLNTIILRATDLAGNVATTNLAVTLDYNNVTNPPALQLTWPEAGVQLSGDRFTVRGQLDDETAQITALVVDVNANTNVVEGLVERNGAFWIEDVPLTAGESSLTLTARNAAGLETNLTLTLTRSDVELTIDPVPPDVSLYDGKTTVSGTISAADYSITVNGVPVTSIWPAGAGWEWYVENVPVVGRGTATFDVVATPPESANPPPPVAVSEEVEMPACIRIVEHRLIKSASDTSNDGYVNSSARVKTYTAQYRADPSGSWIPAYDGTATDLFSDSRTQYSGEYDYVWSESGASTHYSNSDGVDYSVNSIYEPHREVTGLPDEDLCEIGTPPSWIYHYYASGVNHNWSHSDGSYSDAAVMARTAMKLFTGGKAGVGRRNLFCLDGWADEYGKPSESGWLHTPVIPIRNDRVRALGRWFGTDGKLWVALPDNASPDLLLSAPARHYYATAEPTKYKVTITASSSTTNADLSVDKPEFCVGQKVTFTLAGLPEEKITNMVGSWNLTDKFVNEEWQREQWVPGDPFGGGGYFSPYGSVNYRVNGSLLANTNQTSCWYVNGAGGRIGVRMKLLFNNGQYVSVAVKGGFNVERPQAALVGNSATIGPVHVEASGQWFPGAILSSGGVAFNATITSSNSTGEANWVQLINRSLTGDGLTPAEMLLLNTSGFELDNDYFYNTLNGDVGSPAVNTVVSPGATTVITFGTDIGNNNIGTGDEPAIGIISTSFLDVSDSFKTYLVFNPDPADANNIWVTLGRVGWGWDGSAAFDIAETKWVLVNGSTNFPSFINTDEFPDWSVIYHNKK